MPFHSGLSFNFGSSKGPGGRDPKKTFEDLLPGVERGFEQFNDALQSRDDNPFILDIINSQEDLLGRLARMSGQLDGLPDMLKRSALGSTDAGAVAAMQAAKAAGAGRGGVAFGGGGALAAATRAAQGAATQQGAALASALVQGQQAKAGFELQLSGLQGSVADSLSKGRIAQAGLFERRQDSSLDARQRFFDILGQMSIAGMGGTGGSPSTRARSFNVGAGG